MRAETRRTTCSRDCPDACGIVATVEDGQVTQLAGDPEHPVTRGFLCFRTSRFVDAQNAEHRLRQPLLRVDGELVPVEMERALDVAAERLLRIREESGPEAIFHYRSGGSLGLLKLVSDRFFERFGPCATKIGDICSGAGEAAQLHDLGVSDSNDLFDLRHSRHIFLWGKNPFVSSVHLVPVLKKVRADGARITLVDPVHHKGATLADRIVKPRPGQDDALAMGMARVLLDEGRLDAEVATRCANLEGFTALVRRRDVAGWAGEAGVDPGVVAAMAHDLADGPAAILVGWGMQRRSNGAAIVRCLDALSAVTGNLWRPGGGCSFYFGRRRGFDTAALAQGPDIAPRHIREPLFGQDVLAAKDPPIRAIWVTAGNPVSMLPDAPTVARAFEETEFTVVVDPFLTDTGRRASLVFPAPTLLEDDDLLGAYGHHWLAESRPVVPPPDGVLHEVELFRALAERVGLADAVPDDVDGLKRRLLSRVAEHGVRLEDLREGAVRNPLATERLFEDGRVDTDSGRVELIEALPDARSETGEFPLWLFSNSTERAQASQWAGRGLGERTWVAVHPSAVPWRSAGDTVTVESELGSVEAELRFDPDQREDVAIMPKGGHYDRGHSANALIAARTTDMGLGAAYLDCRVRIQ